eukprot:6583478-Pyramimonas_sp.AAC.1
MCNRTSLWKVLVSNRRCEKHETLNVNTKTNTTLARAAEHQLRVHVTLLQGMDRKTEAYKQLKEERSE